MKRREKLDKEIAKKLHMNVTKLGVDVPDSTIENDSIYIPPAAMSDGSSSRLLREQERSQSRDHHKNDTALKRPALPHLASGESYHGGIYNKDYYKEGFPLTDTPEDSEPVERKPRHEPGTVKNLNASSLNYLRSLSTSRARADNDRRAMGVDVNDQEDLKETGGLIGDGNMTQIADLEEAMDSILSEVSSIAKPSDEHKLAAGATLPLSAESLEKKKETDGKMNEIDEKDVEGTAEETAEKNVEKTEKIEEIEKTENTAEKTVENTTNTADTSSETSQEQAAQGKHIDEDTQKKEFDERSEAEKQPEVTQIKPENVSESDTTKKQNVKELDLDHLGERASKEKRDTSLNADLKEDMEDHPKSESGEKATSDKRDLVEPVGSGGDSAELVVDAESSVKKSEKSEQVEDDTEKKSLKGACG
ncbi:hypothetical protein HII12_003463 [Brettanomyces bruxellensis]|uniref:Uncharacterized protein n=1 Tax=Dekkera bruxellensis TaxID=5007 RepID=A0A8H6BE51_DEKBR|nr:hypothetical protein HII12_003463 [Brettanomyces bruxellensis]